MSNNAAAPGMGRWGAAGGGGARGPSVGMPSGRRAPTGAVCGSVDLSTSIIARARQAYRVFGLVYV